MCSLKSMNFYPYKVFKCLVCLVDGDQTTHQLSSNPDSMTQSAQSSNICFSLSPIHFKSVATCETPSLIVKS